MKRLFWASFGYAAGLGSSIWVQRRLRRTVDRYTPEQVRQQMNDRTRDLADRARQTVIDLRDAAVEGRVAMRQSEQELRSEFDGGRHSNYRGGAGSVNDRPERDAPTRPRIR